MANSNGNRIGGVVGFFDGPEALLEGMRKLRAQNYENFDAFSPFPIHGMDDAQGLKQSIVPYITLVGGVTGFCTAVALTMYTSGYDWPIIVGGKEYTSWQAFVPIMFELTVLLAALSTFAGMMLLNRLPNVIDKAFDPGITRDRFALWIGAPAGQPKIDDHGDDEALQKWRAARSKFKPFTADQAQADLKALGAQEVRTVMAEGWF